MQGGSPIRCLPYPTQTQSSIPCTGPSFYTDAFLIHPELWYQRQATVLTLCGFWVLASCPHPGFDCGWEFPPWTPLSCCLFSKLLIPTPWLQHGEAFLPILQRLTPVPMGKPCSVLTLLWSIALLCLRHRTALLIPLNGFWAQLLGKGKRKGKKKMVFNSYQL